MAVSNITLLSFAAQSETDATSIGRNGSNVSAGTSTPLDTSLNATLRVAFQISADMGTEPDATLAIESGPTSAGPWTTLAQFKMSPNAPVGSPNRWDPAPRAVVAADSFTRVRWSVFGTRPGSVKLNLGCAGTAMP